MGTRSVPTLDVDPFDATSLADPDPMHAVLRDAGPLVYLPRYDVYAMARYAQVHAALVDWQRFRSGAGVGLLNFRFDEPWRKPSVLLETDPPWHDAPRRVLSAILAPHAVRRLREEWLATARRLVDEVLAEDEFDAVTAFAEELPLRVFPAAVGLAPESDWRRLLAYGDHMTNAFGPRNRLVLAGEAEAPANAAWVDDRCARDVLAPDGFGARTFEAAERGEITAEQAPMVVRSLLSAGVDTIVQGLAWTLHLLATHPAQWARLRREPGLARVAFDEAIRWATPVQTFFRTAATDVTVEPGLVVPDGKKILMFLGGANRDPRHWPDADSYDLGRDPSGHVGFGFGIHQCVGQHIARLEAEALLTALVERVETLAPAAEPIRHLNNTLRAWGSLPMRVRRG
ncbi:cytochrome P450 [Pseudonocardia sulfidoxydans]|uniref:cytochrome P450 n=1 Tax=Pseudonocardia sulfidoxydans TaxID=54011 RepID=UPI00360E70B8